MNDQAQAHDVHDAVYDGITEHDNRLPRWWLVTLWATIAFGIGYWLYFHTLSVGALPRQEFAADLAVLQAETRAREDVMLAGLDDQKLMATVDDKAALERGRAVFVSTCQACHGDKGQGVVGPNLTDTAWLHGSDPLQIMKTVADGVVTKGMPAWKPVLGAGKVRDVTTYLLTLKNTNVAGKAPEGTVANAGAATGG